MAYNIDLAASAKRHWQDGKILFAARRWQAAGYHFGFAAECALKLVFFKHGIPRSENRRDDPYWAHFPELRTLLIRDGKGRLTQKLYDQIAHGSFMQDWNTDMRYAPDGAVVEARAIIWRDRADALFGHILF